MTARAPEPAGLENTQRARPSRALAVPTLQAQRVWNGAACKAALQGAPCACAALAGHGGCARRTGQRRAVH